MDTDDPRNGGDTLPAGTFLQEYRIVRVLGQGGFGITYRAEVTQLGHQVAIKEFLPRSMAQRDRDGISVRSLAGARQQEAFDKGRHDFLREGRTLAHFRHRAIVRVVRFFEANGTAYLVLEFEVGTSLSAWLDQLGRVPTENDLRTILLPILDGLSEIHAAGYLHRDIKPDNIIIRPDHSAVLIDFGAARYTTGSQSQELTAILTPGYAPLEQYFGDGEQGPWTDIYALGAVLYWAITGRKPPEAPARLQGNVMVPAAEAAEGRYSAPFLRAIDRALQMNPAERHRSIDDWRTMLAAPAPEPTVLATARGGQRVRSPAPKRRRPRWLIGIVGAAIAGGIAAAGWWWGLPPAQPVEPAVPGHDFTDPVSGIAFVWVPGGQYQMGCGLWSGDCFDDEKPLHTVTLPGFWLGRTEVTQGQWRRVMGDNPALFTKGDDYPVEQVSWADAETFIERLNRNGRDGFRLPSEAEWEYACRSGGRAETWCGNGSPDAIAWHDQNAGSATHPVATRQPNGLGLFDMSGNVWEWLQDCYYRTYDSAVTDAASVKTTVCFARVLRGGSWANTARDIRSATRDATTPGDRTNNIGLRIARTGT